MFRKLSQVQFTNLMYLILKCELKGYSLKKNYPLPNSYLQYSDVYAIAISEKKIAKKIFITCKQMDWVSPEEMEAEFTIKENLIDNKYFSQKDEYWIAVSGRFDATCIQYKEMKGLKMIDKDWIVRRIKKYFKYNKKLRLYILTLQSAGLLEIV